MDVVKKRKEENVPSCNKASFRREPRQGWKVGLFCHEIRKRLQDTVFSAGDWSTLDVNSR